MPRAVRKQLLATDFATKREFDDVHGVVETITDSCAHWIERAVSLVAAHSRVTLLPASTTIFFGVFVIAERAPACYIYIAHYQGRQAYQQIL